MLRTERKGSIVNVELGLVADFPCNTGENPLWHPDEQRIYWVDIPAGRIYRHRPSDGATEHFDVGAAVGGFTVQADGRLLLFMARGAVKVWQDGRIVQTVIEELPDDLDTRFNDVIADPEGRVFCGTMSAKSHPGRLYRLDRDGSIAQLLDGIGTSNGLGFTPDGRGLYYTDTPKREIYLFDYDRATGAITNRRVFVRTPEAADEGRPDGMTVDAAGCVWSTRWDGWCAVRYDAQGRETDRIRFPVKKVSSVAFGGRDFGDMYFTTAGGQNRGENGPLAGSLFHCRLEGIRGVAEFRSRVSA
jgi:sugar lactone lactonase YvrE